MAMLGLLYLVLAFLCCFCLVHFVKLAYMGLQSLKQKPEAKKEEPKKDEAPKPVYYIVEKKRAKRSYSNPREIEFK